MRLPAIGDGAAGQHGRQARQTRFCGGMDAFVTFQHRCDFGVARVGHLEGQRHVTLLEPAAAGAGLRVLLVAAQRDGILFVRGDAMRSATRSPVCSMDRPLQDRAKNCPTPSFMRAGAAGAGGIGW